MKGLYKGKYLIAVYDKNDYLIDVACMPSQLSCFKNNESVMSYINRVAKGTQKSKRIYLIDVTEKHNDIFAEEDQLFLEYIEETNTSSLNQTEINKQKAVELGISLRTYYRRKAAYKERVM